MAGKATRKQQWASDPCRRVMEAARDLIVQEGWRALTMVSLAKKANLSLAELYKHIPDKRAILARFFRDADLAVLGAPPAVSLRDPPRDRLFDVLMAHFEALKSEQKTLRAIWNDLMRIPVDAVSVWPALSRSVSWLMDVAGLGKTATGPLARNAILIAYIGALRVFVFDDDPGLAKTMATLDRGLRQLEPLWKAAPSSGDEAQSRPPATKRTTRRKSS